MADGQNTATFLGLLKGVAPILGTVLAAGNPLGGVAANAAVDFLAGKLNLPTKTPEAVTEALSQLPATSLAQLEYEFKQHCADNNLKLEEDKVQDRVSARTMFAVGYRLIGAIAIMTVLGFYVAIAYVLRGGLKGMSPEELVIVGSVIGYLAANTQQVYNYFFGSSSGSDKKTDLMQAIVKNGNGNGH